MTFGIYTNASKDASYVVTKKVEAELKARKVDCYRIVDDIGDCDLVITVGGDGTILRVADACATKDVPILGVNMGHVGFLTEIEAVDIATAIDNYLGGNFRLENRMMIEVDFKGEKYRALNDIVAARDGNTKLITLKIECDGTPVDEFRCDGVVVCTPTGSTAYSLSAGGSAISPRAAVMGLTPISAHTLHTRPVVVSASETIAVTNSGATEAALSIDGEVIATILPNESFSCTGWEKGVKFVRYNSCGFYTRLLNKLNAGEK